MAKKLSDIIKIQNEIVRLSNERMSVDGNELKSIDQRLEAYNRLQASGGHALTKRDEMGNILLYEDSLSPGNQLQRDDQYITVELIKPDYDNNQIKEVLDIKINELYIPTDTSQIARLQEQIERLRKELKDATAPINIQDDVDDTDDTDDKDKSSKSTSIFPANAISLPDLAEGVISDSSLLLNINTGIFEDSSFVLKNIGSANPFSVNWWLIDHVTEEIYAKGVDNTLIRSIDPSTIIIGTDPDSGKPIYANNRDLDIVLQLTNIPNNFNGWYVNDQSTGQLVNYYKFSNDPIVRIRFNKRRVVGNPSIDDQRNTYYIIISFLNEVPKFKGKELIMINIDTADLRPYYGDDNNKVINFTVGTLGVLNPQKIKVVETNEHGVVIQDKIITTPTSITAYEDSKLEVTFVSSDENVSKPSIPFGGWFVKNLLTNNYNKVTSNKTYIVKRLLKTDDKFNWVIGFEEVR